MKALNVFINLDLSCRVALHQPGDPSGAYVVVPCIDGMDRRWKLLVVQRAKGEGYFGDLESVEFRIYLEVATK